MEPESQKGWKLVIKQPGIPLLYAVYFLTFLAFGLFYAGLPVYANTLLNWNATDLGIYLAYSSLVMILVQGPLLSRLSKRFTNQFFILLGSLFLAVSFFLLSNESLMILYLAITLLSIGNGLMWPSFLFLLAKTGNKSMQGAIQGYGNSMGSFASMLGLVMFFFEYIGTKVFVIGGGIFLLITLLMTFNSIKQRNTLKKRAQGLQTQFVP